MYRCIQLTPDLTARFQGILCQDKVHKLPGPNVSKCWAKTKWLIIDEEGARWTVLHHRKKTERFPDGVIWYSKDMAPVDLDGLVEKTKLEEAEEQGDDDGWEIVECEDISEGYVVVR